MFNRILIPLDGSKLAERAIPHASAFARAFGGSMTLLQVLDPSPYRESATATEPFTWQIRKAEAEVYMQNLSGELRSTGLQVDYAIREGKAAENIIDYAHTENIELVVLTTHGVSGLSRWNMSSVVEKVIEKVYLPLLLVRSYHSGASPEEIAREASASDEDGRLEASQLGDENPAQIAAGGGSTPGVSSSAAEKRRPQPVVIPTTGDRIHYHRVLMPIDCSRRAECSLPAGITLGQYEQQADAQGDESQPGAQADGFTLILASVIHPPEIPLQPPYPDEFNQLTEQYVRLSQSAVENTFRDLAARIPVKTETRTLVSDSVSAALHDLAEQESADLVILCAHGQTGRNNWPYGSIANNFIRYSDKSVLVVQDIPRSQFPQTAAETAAQKYGRR